MTRTAKSAALWVITLHGQPVRLDKISNWYDTDKPWEGQRYLAGASRKLVLALYNHHVPDLPWRDREPGIDIRRVL